LGSTNNHSGSVRTHHTFVTPEKGEQANLLGRCDGDFAITPYGSRHLLAESDQWPEQATEPVDTVRNRSSQFRRMCDAQCFGNNLGEQKDSKRKQDRE